MTRKDTASVAIVFCLFLAVLIYEYRVSVNLVPSMESNSSAEAAFKGISPGELMELSKNRDDFTLIDVRLRKDYDNGHIPGAISISFSDIVKKSNELNKDKLTILYCESGPWSRFAYKELKDRGFNNLRLLNNGIVGWKWEIKGEISRSK